MAKNKRYFPGHYALKVLCEYFASLLLQVSIQNEDRAWADNIPSFSRTKSKVEKDLCPNQGSML
jgi:hypothetical protein